MMNKFIIIGVVFFLMWALGEASQFGINAQFDQQGEFGQSGQTGVSGQTCVIIFLALALVLVCNKCHTLSEKNLHQKYRLQEIWTKWGEELKRQKRTTEQDYEKMKLFQNYYAQLEDLKNHVQQNFDQKTDELEAEKVKVIESQNEQRKLQEGKEIVEKENLEFKEELKSAKSQLKKYKAKIQKLQKPTSPRIASPRNYPQWTVQEHQILIQAIFEFNIYHLQNNEDTWTTVWLPHLHANNLLLRRNADACRQRYIVLWNNIDIPGHRCWKNVSKQTMEKLLPYFNN